MNKRNHFICNVLKGGSTSWDVFFQENNISNIKTFYCDYTGGDGGGGHCSDNPHLRILQVRHPFERLVSTYRHVFKAGGWKSLDQMYSANPRLEQLFTRFFNKSWTEFVEEVVIQNSFPISEENLRNTVQHCTDHDIETYCYIADSLSLSYYGYFLALTWFLLVPMTT